MNLKNDTFLNKTQKEANMNNKRLFYSIVLLSVCGNFFIALQSLNFSATMGWIVALCWFPYKNIRTSKQRSNQK